MVSTPQPPGTPLQQIGDTALFVPANAELEASTSTITHHSAIAGSERRPRSTCPEASSYSPPPSSEPTDLTYASVAQNEKETACLESLPMDVLVKLRNEANSRRNFALKQAEKMFTFDERLTSNCQGKRGKKRLDAKRIDLIKLNTLKLWPLENKEDEAGAWKDCRKAIDEGGRQLNLRLRLQPKTSV